MRWLPLKIEVKQTRLFAAGGRLLLSVLLLTRWSARGVRVVVCVRRWIEPAGAPRCLPAPKALMLCHALYFRPIPSPTDLTRGCSLG